MCIKPQWYVRVDSAFAHARESFKDSTPSCTQLDDILISGGYSHVLNDKTRFTISGFCGIPTHKNKGLLGLQFGTGHVGLGTQIDGSYYLSPDTMLILAARYIYFVPETVQICIQNKAEWRSLGIGNLADLFVALNKAFRQRHTVEVGYDATFLFGTSVYPFVPTFIQQIESTYSSFYASYRYGFLMHNQPSELGAAFSYSRGLKCLQYNNKHILSVWLFWGINF
jgi:hypothetical protein